MEKILTVGEIMLELSEVGDGLYQRSFAGDTFNIAYYLTAVSGGEHEVEYMTSLGTDEVSEECSQFMQAHGVGVARCVRDSERTIGLFLLSNDAHGEKRYGYWRGQSAARCLFDVRRDLSGYAWVCFSGITAAVSHHRKNLVASVTEAKQQGVRLIYDFNHRDLLWSAGDARAFAECVLSEIDIVKISDEELALLFPDETVGELSQSYPNADWVLTCKKQKSEIWKNGAMIAQQIFAPTEITVETTVVDTSGAGDAFLAAYLAAKLAGATPEDALRKGHEIASQVVRVKGSITAVEI